MARVHVQQWVKHLIAALLVIIALQAVPAGAMSQVPDRGPAFSASSSEVSLGPRRDVVAESRLAPVPLPLIPVSAEVTYVAAIPGLSVWSRANARAPPHRWPLSRDRSPRGPPQS
jgi:hypothetical protein